MTDKNMKILVTGGSGFIGSRFVEKFVNEYDFTIFTLEQTTRLIETSIKTEYGTVSDKKVVKIIQNFNPDIVIHLAAFSGLKKCEENPEKAFDTNVIGTSNVIEGCLEANAKLVFISTREVYGLTNRESSENDKLNPINVYGKTKMQAEKLVQDASEKHGLDYTILRLTNVYGPKGNSGINKLIKDASEKGRIFVSGGEQILNFIFLDDVVELIHLVLENNKSSHQIFNIGSKETMSLKNFVEILTELLDRDIEIQFGEKPNFESSFFQPNIEKQENILSSQINVGCEEGIKRTLDYFKEVDY